MNTTKFFKILSLSVLVSLSGGMFAQNSMGGKMMIQQQGAIAIYGNHNFATGGNFVNPGIIHTSRSGDGGVLVFAEGSSWTGATKGRFVDGYVKVGHSNAFIFPIGNKDLYRPVAISGGLHTSAAYFAKSPAQPLSNSKISGLTRVSDKEYWEVTGQERTQLSFTWGRESNIANITSGNLDRLTLVGWKNGSWQIIPSEINKSFSNDLIGGDKTKITQSDFINGSITVIDPILPDDYDYFSLGAIQNELEFNEEFITVFPNPVVKELHIDLGHFNGKVGSIKIFNIDGKEMTSRVLAENAASIQQFDASNYENGMYKVYINIDQKTHTTKFIVGRKY